MQDTVGRGRPGDAVTHRKGGAAIGGRDGGKGKWHAADSAAQDGDAIAKRDGE
ncbi:hypothetical protein [Dankookia rubra]|uniref:hypothetical protein n=1 Tax=Dankookia rubra TaxID=1442381 RepID=UPI00140A7E08|nr:hypothetical protein [Dankookia rubra]